MSHWDGATIKSFLGDLDRQKDLYAAMLSKTRSHIEQLATVEAPEALIGMLAEKRELMAELEAVEGRLAPLKKTWPDNRESLPEKVTAFVDSRLAELQTTLRELIETEDEANRLITERIAGNRAKLGSMTKKNQASRAYVAKPAKGDPRFLDSQS